MSQQEQNSGRGNPFGWIGAFMKGLKDYNVFELLKVLFAAACVTFMVLLITKPEIIFEQVDKVIESVTQAREDRHADGAAFRLRADENIRGELTWLLETTGADRAFIMEFHNGSSNLSSGLPFVYLDLTLEVGAEGEPPLREGEFKDLRTAQYPMVGLLLEHGYWFGTLEELKAIDQRLYYHLAAHDVSEVAVMKLPNKQAATGFLCLTWHGEHRMDARPTGEAIRASGVNIALELAILDRLTGYR